MEYRPIIDASDPNYRSKLADDIRDTMRDYNVRGRANGAAPPPKRKTKLATFTAAELDDMRFPDLKFVVPGYVTEGVTVLAGAPKVGKSWLVLDIGIAVAVGGTCLGGIKCEQGGVLYLALEDNKRRLQRRMDKLQIGEKPAALAFATECPRDSQGGIEAIQEWIDQAENPRLVIVDVLAMFRTPRGDKQSAYEADYAAVKALQELAGKTGIAIVIVHHVRKGGSDLDPFEEVSGTFGIMGAADAGLVLRRDARGLTLYVRGRDIEEAETAVEYDRATCRWRVLGEAAEVHRTDERGAILQVLREADEPMKPGEIAVATSMGRNNVDQLLYKMAKGGEITKTGRGLYVHPDRTDLIQADPLDTDKNDKKIRNDPQTDREVKAVRAAYDKCGPETQARFLNAIKRVGIDGEITLADLEEGDHDA